MLRSFTLSTFAWSRWRWLPLALVFAALLVGGFSSAVASARTWRGPQQLAGARPGTYRDSVVLSDGGQALAAWSLPVPVMDSLNFQNRAALGSVTSGFRRPLNLPGQSDPAFAFGDPAGDQLVIWDDRAKIRRGNQPLREIKPFRNEVGFGIVHQLAVTPRALIGLEPETPRLVLRTRAWRGTERPPIDLGPARQSALATNRRGDALIAWATTQTDTSQVGSVFATVRHANGTIGPVEDVGRGTWQPNGQISGAINNEGDALVAWGAPGYTAMAAYRPAAQPWQAPTMLGTPIFMDPPKVALDARGGASVAWSYTHLHGQASAPSGTSVHVSVRNPAGQWATQVVASSSTGSLGYQGGAGLSLGVDANGNGLLVFNQTTGNRRRLPPRWAYRPAGRSFRPAHALPERLRGLVSVDDLSVNARGQAVLLGRAGRNCNPDTIEGIGCALQAASFR